MKPLKEKDIPSISKIVEQNVNALLNRKQEEHNKKSTTDKIAISITHFAGSMASIYAHIIFFGVWVLWNVGLLNLEPFDPTFIILATYAGIEAIFLTTFVLIGQKHLNEQSAKWADLDLQVSLLSEYEITAVLNVVTAIAKKMDIETAENKELEELSKRIHPNKVLDTMEKASE